MDKQLKILTVCTSDISGGAARAAYRIMKGIQTQGVLTQMFVKNRQTSDTTVIPLKDFIPTNHLFRIGDWIVNKIKNKIQQASWARYPDREDVYMSDLRSTSLHGALQKLDYDVLHLHWFNLRFLNINELQKIKKPIVWTLHDSWAFTGICHYIYNCDKYQTQCGNCPFLHSHKANDLSTEVWQKKQKVYNQLDLHIVTPSRWLAKCTKESTLLGKFLVTVIPNCLDTEIFKPIEQPQRNKKRILYGAMNALKDKNKGFLELLSAIRYIEKKINVADFELVVFGTDKPIEEFDIKMKVNYLEYLKNDEDLVHAYNEADVMVVPSLSENLSNAIMESLSCGTPVTAFGIGGNADMIEHKQNGYLAEAFSSEDLGDGILWCLENNEDECLSKSARQKVEDNFTIERIANQYKTLYDKIHTKMG